MAWRILITRFSDEEYGQKSVSVMLDGQETELEIIDHPAAEMSVSIRDAMFFCMCKEVLLEIIGQLLSRDQSYVNTLHWAKFLSDVLTARK